MDYEFLDSHFLFPNPLTCLGDFLIKFCENATFTLNVKDIKTQQYCMNNRVCAEMWGLSGTGLYGMNTREVLGKIQNFKNLEVELQQANALEHEVIETNTQGIRTQIALTWKEIVRIRKIIVTPITSSRNKCIALATMGIDVTPYVNLNYLFRLYEKYFVKSKAVKKFSEYLKLDHYFQFSLSRGELLVLLTMTKDHRHKQIANLLKLSSSTVASYLTSLKEKLKSNIDLYTALNNLRDYQQCKPEILI